MTKRWSYKHKFHVVADSALGYLNNLKDTKGTFSVKENVLSSVWSLLKRKTKVNHWNAAVNKGDVILSY